jgi:hypothetical protein
MRSNNCRVPLDPSICKEEVDSILEDIPQEWNNGKVCRTPDEATYILEEVQSRISGERSRESANLTQVREDISELENSEEGESAESQSEIEDLEEDYDRLENRIDELDDMEMLVQGLIARAEGHPEKCLCKEDAVRLIEDSLNAALRELWDEAHPVLQVAVDDTCAGTVARKSVGSWNYGLVDLTLYLGGHDSLESLVTWAGEDQGSEISVESNGYQVTLTAIDERGRSIVYEIRRVRDSELTHLAMTRGNRAILSIRCSPEKPCPSCITLEWGDSLSAIKTLEDGWAYEPEDIYAFDVDIDGTAAKALMCQLLITHERLKVEELVHTLGDALQSVT